MVLSEIPEINETHIWSPKLAPVLAKKMKLNAWSEGRCLLVNSWAPIPEIIRAADTFEGLKYLFGKNKIIKRHLIRHFWHPQFIPWFRVVVWVCVGNHIVHLALSASHFKEFVAEIRFQLFSIDWNICQKQAKLFLC